MTPTGTGGTGLTASPRGTILVVDDEANIADLVELYLRKEGFRVLKAATGEDGLAAAKRERPRLVVLDVGLPGIDGLEVCRRLRADASLRHWSRSSSSPPATARSTASSASRWAPTTTSRSRSRPGSWWPG